MSKGKEKFKPRIFDCKLESMKYRYNKHYGPEETDFPYQASDWFFHTKQQQDPYEVKDIYKDTIFDFFWSRSISIVE